MSEEKEPVDLSSLENLSFSPNWANEDAGSTHQQKQSEAKSRKKNKRPAKPPPSRAQKSHTPDHEWVFSISPEPLALQTIKQKIKESGLAYSLREIVEVFAERTDRIKVKIRPKRDDDYIWKSKLTNKFFTTKRNAVLELIYAKEKSPIQLILVKEEAPKGNFQYIFQCPKTKSFLPPTSFHNFDDLVRRHAFSSGIGMPHEKYLSSLIKVTEEDKISEWLKCPIPTFSYSLAGLESQKYESLHGLLSALENQHFDRFFQRVDSVVVTGSGLEALDKTLKEKVEGFLSIRHKWKKELFMACLVHFKRSKFCLFKNREALFVRHGERKPINDANLNELSSKIVSEICSRPKVTKKELIQSLLAENFDLKKVVLEIKWLAKEGYLNEYSDSTIALN